MIKSDTMQRKYLTLASILLISTLIKCESKILLILIHFRGLINNLVLLLIQILYKIGVVLSFLVGLEHIRPYRCKMVLYL